MMNSDERKKLGALAWRMKLEKRKNPAPGGKAQAGDVNPMDALARQFGHVKQEKPVGDAAGTEGPGAGTSAPAAKGAEGGSRGAAAKDGGKPKEKGGIRQLSQWERTKPNKWENGLYIDLMILRNSIRTKGIHVKERLKKANPYGWRDMRLLEVLVDRLLDTLNATMPDSRLEYYTMLAQHGKYHLHMDGPIKQGRIVLITDKNLGAILEAAMENECLMCVRDGRECEKCLIRTALLEVGPAMDINPENEGIGCEYRHLAGMLARGEEITDV